MIDSRGLQILNINTCMACKYVHTKTNEQVCSIIYWIPIMLCISTNTIRVNNEWYTYTEEATIWPSSQLCKQWTHTKKNHRKDEQEECVSILSFKRQNHTWTEEFECICRGKRFHFDSTAQREAYIYTLWNCLHFILYNICI